jgi:hypothetical protein
MSIQEVKQDIEELTQWLKEHKHVTREQLNKYINQKTLEIPNEKDLVNKINEC